MNRIEYLIMKYKEDLQKTTNDFEQSFKLFANNQMPDEIEDKINNMIDLIKEKQYKMLRCIDTKDYEDIIILESIDRRGDI